MIRNGLVGKFGVTYGFYRRVNHAKPIRLLKIETSELSWILVSTVDISQLKTAHPLSISNWPNSEKNPEQLIELVSIWVTVLKKGFNSALTSIRSKRLIIHPKFNDRTISTITTVTFCAGFFTHSTNCTLKQSWDWICTLLSKRQITRKQLKP